MDTSYEPAQAGEVSSRYYMSLSGSHYIIDCALSLTNKLFNFIQFNSTHPISVQKGTKHAWEMMFIKVLYHE